MANSFKNNWFTELGALNSSKINVSIKIDKVIEQRRSRFQDILVFYNDVFGRCLVLDNAIQCTELDESSYQEMISFLPLNIHPNPKRVLIIGGGDGGVAREVDKHPLVEQIVQCEIDEEVVNVCKEHLPFMSCGFQSKKLDLRICDGFKFVLENKNQFDVIITDSSDPKGPAVALFESKYYEALYECLRPGGVIACQAESFWFDLDFIKNINSKVKAVFPSVAYASTAVASYPSGQIGFLVCSKDPDVDFKRAKHIFSPEQVESMNLKYYSSEMHTAAFTLPTFLQKQLS